MQVGTQIACLRLIIPMDSHSHVASSPALRKAASRLRHTEVLPEDMLRLRASWVSSKLPLPKPATPRVSDLPHGQNDAREIGLQFRGQLWSYSNHGSATSGLRARAFRLIVKPEASLTV